MAPVKPMAAREKSERRDKNPLTKPGVTGFEQDYNEEEPPRQDLNPDAVTEDSILPEPVARDTERAGRGGAASARTPRASGRARKGVRSK